MKLSVIKLDGKASGDVELSDAVFGITEFAASQLGTVVFVDLPVLGTKLAAGTEFGAVESVKAASDLFAPLSGVVTAVNEDLIGDPEGVNRDAFGAWMIRVKLQSPAEAAKLLEG